MSCAWACECRGGSGDNLVWSAPKTTDGRISSSAARITTAQGFTLANTSINDFSSAASARSVFVIASRSGKRGLIDGNLVLSQLRCGVQGVNRRHDGVEPEVIGDEGLVEQHLHDGPGIG